MRVDTLPAAAAAGAPAALRSDEGFGEPEHHRITDAAERLALLTEVRDRATPVLMHAPDGHALRTTLWVVDATASRLAFAVAAAELAAPYIAPLLQADEVTAVAHPGPMKLQFELSGLVLVRGHASAVLQAGWPDEMLRIQRRESYRVTPPLSAPVAYLRHPAIPDMSLALRVLDLSLGGCALRLPEDVPPIEPGTRIGAAIVELDLDTRLRVELTLQHLTQMGEPKLHGARLGCEWRLLRADDERALQRWIDRLQGRQRLVQRAGTKAAEAEPTVLALPQSASLAQTAIQTPSQPTQPTHPARRAANERVARR